MKAFISKYWRPTLTACSGIAIFLFWIFGYPQSMSYQEQNQMFLFSSDYFFHDVSIAGGFVDYMSEFLVQFYYVEWIGALILSLLFVAVQILTWLVIKSLFNHCLKWYWYALSFIPPLLLLAVMGDVNVLLSFPVSVACALLAALLMKRHCQWADVLLIPIFYWLIGGMVWLYVILRVLYGNWKRLWIAVYLLAVQLLAYNTVLQQWPVKSVIFGLNYYRIPMQFPGQHFGYDRDMYELICQDYLVRNGNWDEIIDRARKYQVHTAFSSQCVNLALAQTRQLADCMFDFYQSGGDALIMPMVRDNTSDIPTMEAFWRLGMVNSSLRYAFDVQESILNGKKSGRLTKRIAEGFIVNGNYKVAQKYLDILKQTLFYRSWAVKAETLLYNESAINNDPVLGKIRRLRFKRDFLYNYDEIDRMLGLLFINNPDNKMALDYFMGEILLKGNIQGFQQYMSWVQQYGGYQMMPYGYQDAVKCIQAHGELSGSAYANYVRRMMSKGGEQ